MPVLQIENSRNDNATLTEIEAAISRLDGADRSLVLVELPSGMTLTVGGGPDRFVAEVAESDTTRFAVIDPASGDDPIDLVVGGSSSIIRHACVWDGRLCSPPLARSCGSLVPVMPV
jgi:hypothetical protein